MGLFSALMGHASEVSVVRTIAIMPIKKELTKAQNISEVYHVLSPYGIGAMVCS